MPPAETVSLTIPPAWHQVAAYVGHKDVRVWIRCVVEDALEVAPLCFVPIRPLTWQRGTFQAIRTADGKIYGPHEVHRPGVGTLRHLPGRLLHLGRPEARHRVHPCPRSHGPQDRHSRPPAELQAARRGAGASPHGVAPDRSRPHWRGGYREGGGHHPRPHARRVALSRAPSMQA